MPDYLQSAKDGSVGAIEVLMNKSFGSRGVTVRVTKSGPTLTVILKSSAAAGPDKRLGDRVKAGLVKISPKGFDGAVIEGKTITPDKLVWSTQWGVLPVEDESQPAVPLVTVVKEPRSFYDFKLDTNLEGYQKWVVLGLLGVLASMGAWFWWVTRFERQASRVDYQPEMTTALPPPSEPQEPEATDEELQEFINVLVAVDPDDVLISGVQQYDKTGLLFLAVGPGFLTLDEISQGDLAINLRDLWGKACDCPPHLVFQSPAGQEIVTIYSHGQPKRKKR